MGDPFSVLHKYRNETVFAKLVMVFVYGMKELIVPIDQAGRIVLPREVRRELAIKPGEKLKVSVHGASVTLTPDREPRGLVRKGRALVFSTGADEVLTEETVGRTIDGTRELRAPGIRGRASRPKTS